LNYADIYARQQKDAIQETRWSKPRRERRRGALQIPLGRSLPILLMARLGVAMEQAVSAAANTSADGWSAVPSAALGLSVRLD
jgi:hypothetical protein